jgi:hypothetical protein
VRSHLKTAVVAALVGAVAATATVALAGSGVGGVFNLGQSNTVSQTSLLAGSTAGDQLDVANLNTGSAAKALGLLGKSPTAPALNAANTGGGPALGLTVNSGKAPFTVNSPTKVSNLNADKLDGLDSSSFTSTGSGSTKIFTDRAVLASGAEGDFLTLPGFGILHAFCSPNSADLYFINFSGVTLDFWWDALEDGHPHGTLLADGDSDRVSSYFQGQQDGGPFALGFGNDPGARRTAIGQSYAYQSGYNQPCGFEASVTVWNSL